MNIMAVMVIYNPNIKELNRSLNSIIKQVDRILIINNSSNAYNPEDLLSNYTSKIIIINNGGNKGIAAALNQGLEYAYINNYEWALTLDQDSLSPSNIIKEYISTSHSYNNVGIICPYIYDKNKGELINHINDIEEIYDETEVITSGSFINVEAAMNIGGYDEELFIDYVDTEFQKRLLLSNYKIIRNNNVVLVHEVGRIEVKRFFHLNIICTNHSPSRRYYQVRNRLYYNKKYYGKIALMNEMIRLVLGTVKILIYEDEKILKLKSTIRGFRDYRKLLV